MAKVCSKCGRTLGALEDDFDGMCYECNESTKIRRTVNANSSMLDNPVAQKFDSVIKIIKILGYVVAIIVTIGYFLENEVGIGILVGIIIAGLTWLSTLGLEAIEEIINLLQEIVDKLRN